MDTAQKDKISSDKSVIFTNWQEKLSRRAQRAEDDIQAGRLYSREQVVAQINRRIQ